MTFKLKQIKLLFAFVFAPFIILSQHNCDSLCLKSLCLCENDPTPAGVMISHVHKKNEWMVSYRFMNMNMNGIQTGANSLSQNDVLVNYLMAPKDMNMNMHMLMGMFGVTNRITLMGMFNYASNSMNMTMYASGHHHGGSSSTSNEASEHNMRTSGFGDAEIHTLISLINVSQHQLLFSAGMNIPTGRVDLKGANDAHMYANERYPYMMQLGSGTYDALPCLNYVYQKNRFTFSTQASAIIRFGYNNIGYALGNKYTSNTWCAYQWHECFSTSVRAEGNMMGEIEGYDPKLYYFYEPSANPNNYGGKRVNCYAGIKARGKRGFLRSNQLALEYGVPVYQNLNGVQMTNKYSIMAAWSVLF